MSPWILYFIFKLDDIQAFAESLSGVFAPLAIIICLAAIGAYVGWRICEGKEKKVACTACNKLYPVLRKVGIALTIAAIFFATLQMLLPSTKQMVAIYVVPIIVNNEHVQAIPANMLKIANEYMEKHLRSLQEGAETVTDQVKNATEQVKGVTKQVKEQLK